MKRYFHCDIYNTLACDCARLRVCLYAEIKFSNINANSWHNREIGKAVWRIEIETIATNYAETIIEQQWSVNDTVIFILREANLCKSRCGYFVSPQWLDQLVRQLLSLGADNKTNLLLVIKPTIREFYSVLQKQ